MAKKVNFSRKPSDTKPANVEQWIGSRTVEPEKKTVKMKRLTIDVPVELHTQIKLKATEQGVTMAELLRSLLSERFD